jgi:hypothetical protein
MALYFESNVIFEMPIRFLGIIYEQVPAIGCLTDCYSQLLLATRNRTTMSFQWQDLGRDKRDFSALAVSHINKRI